MTLYFLLSLFQNYCMLIRQWLNILLCKNIILSSHTSLCLRNIIKSDSCESCILHNPPSTAFIHCSTCCRSSFISSRLFFIEIVEIVEHQIHIFLLFTLKVMYYSMIFMNFYSNMSVRLSRYCSWFYKLAFLVVV